jgi:FAD/FMN-containing dehydrogenase
MTTIEFTAAMESAFGSGRLRHDWPLASFTTFRVGGPAEWLFEARTSDEILAAVTLASRADVPVTMLGGGSCAGWSSAPVAERFSGSMPAERTAFAPMPP